jgi:hypothetical protein
MRKALATTLLITLLSTSFGPAAVAASSSNPIPSVQWKCRLSRLLDHRGLVVFFSPSAKMSWFGKEGFYKFYDTSDKTKSLTDSMLGRGTVKGDDKKLNTSSIYLNWKFRNLIDPKSLSVLVVVTDLKNQTSQTSCTWSEAEIPKL